MHAQATAAPKEASPGASEVKLKVEIGPVFRGGEIPIATARVGRADALILPVEERTVEFLHNDVFFVVDDLTMGTVGVPALKAAVIYAIGAFVDGPDAGKGSRPAFTVGLSLK